MGQNTISMCAIENEWSGGLIVTEICWPRRPSSPLPMFQIVKCPWRNHFFRKLRQGHCAVCAQCIHLVGQEDKKIKDPSILKKGSTKYHESASFCLISRRVTQWFLQARLASLLWDWEDLQVNLWVLVLWSYEAFLSLVFLFAQLFWDAPIN